MDSLIFSTSTFSGVYCMCFRGRDYYMRADWAERIFISLFFIVERLLMLKARVYYSRKPTRFVNSPKKSARSTTRNYISRKFAVPFFFFFFFCKSLSNRFLSKIYVYIYLLYVYISRIPCAFSLFCFEMASIAHPTLESYVRIYEQSRNSWWFGYGVIGLPMFTIDQSVLMFLITEPPNVPSLSTRHRRSRVISPLIVHTDRSISIFRSSRTSSSILASTNRRRRRDYSNGDQSQNNLLSLSNCSPHHVAEVSQKTVYKTLSLRKLD